MLPHRIQFTTLLIFLIGVSTPFLLHPTVSFSPTPVLALSTDARKADADLWLQQGIQPLQMARFEAARPSNQQAVTTSQDMSDREYWGHSLNQLGLVLYQKGQLQEAEKTLRDAIEMWESRQSSSDSHTTDQSSIYETQATTYRILQKVLIAQNKIDAALEIAERGRVFAFLELLEAHSDRTSTVTSKITPPTIQKIQQIARVQNATLVEYSVIYAHLDELDQPQAQESELFIWVIQPTGEITFRKSALKPLWEGETTTLEEFVSSIRKSLSGLEWASTNASRKKIRPFQQLYQVLIQPIVDKLPTNPEARVIFIPQQSLFMIPFSPIQDASGRYLIEQYTIQTSPAIALLDLTHQQRQRIPKSIQKWLVVGNPEPMPRNFPPLPSAEQEALAIASLAKTQALTGKAATKELVVQQMGFSRVIHLATHGLLDEKRGLNSAIALAASSTDSGWLKAKEILNLKLSAELVVLSACNTGRGSVTGDGIIGLSSSLILSGASGAIVSLWAIPDSPTGFLMKEFYGYLQQNSDKAQALRQAMLTTMKKYPALRDWAAFTLVGEAQ